jgi:phage antirepressor YoqD-like protein
MERIGEEQKMTVKEVADVLGCKPDTVQKIARRLEEEGCIARIEIRPDFSKALLLNVEQVQKIKENLVPRTLDMKVQGEKAVTEIEKQQTIILAMQYLQENLDAMKERAIKAERKNAILMHVSKTYTAGEIAKELGMRSAQELNQALADKGIQYKQNGTWLPTADNSSCGYFEIKQQELESGKVIYDRRITQTGREFILSLFEEGER